MFDTVLNAPPNLQQTNCIAIKRFHNWCFLDNILNFFRSTFFSNTRGKLLLENARIPLCEKWPFPEFFWSIFSCIRTEYGDLPYKSPFSVRMWGNTDQKKVCNGYFSPSVSFCDKNRKVPEDFSKYLCNVFGLSAVMITSLDSSLQNVEKMPNML